MRIEKIEEKIKEQQGIIIEAKAKLDAWYEVHEEFTVPETRSPKPRKQLPKDRILLMPHLHAALGEQKGQKFTSRDLSLIVEKRIGGGDPHKISTMVCSYLYTVVKGKTKNPLYKIVACGKRGKLKLYQIK